SARDACRIRRCFREGLTRATVPSSKFWQRLRTDSLSEVRHERVTDHHRRHRLPALRLAIRREGCTRLAGCARGRIRNRRHAGGCPPTATAANRGCARRSFAHAYPSAMAPEGHGSADRDRDAEGRPRDRGPFRLLRKRAMTRARIPKITEGLGTEMEVAR